ncbi:uncharacterized protein LOC131893235 [Tigriopus californicus]|uniref:uncharacterized protein LOC131893235 n=1 Tax=Tigriopus californicus TaxID=6832 RepID=UPI0027DAA8CF|nr:uncharacterized protein LOC131893235 [Tigriopus californicus]
MYFESGRSGNVAGQIDIFQGTGTGERRYNIKVTYIHCSSTYRAPSGCTQYFTGLAGTITSYNFAGGQILENQHYGNCIRQNEGYCSVVYSETPITTPDPFSLSPVPAGDPATVTDNCMPLSHVTVPSQIIQHLDSPQASQSLVTYVPSMRCNKVFGSLPGTAVPGSLESERGFPFVLGFHSRSSEAGALADLGGFSLDFRQKPC